MFRTNLIEVQRRSFNEATILLPEYGNASHLRVPGTTGPLEAISLPRNHSKLSNYHMKKARFYSVQYDSCDFCLADFKRASEGDEGHIALSFRQTGAINLSNEFFHHNSTNLVKFSAE